MVSPRKSTSASSVISNKQRSMHASSIKSCESLYSISSKGSANNIYRRKAPSAMEGNAGCMRQSAFIPATNEVRQRVLSARRLRIKNYQNQLTEAQNTIAELAHENRMLRTLHKRQDNALSKYESTNAELPQLLHSHAEELRMWQTKYRNLLAANKELEQKLKQKDAMVLSLSDQNKHFTQLNKDKNLEDRQKLTEKLHSLETRIQEKDNDLKMLARKMQLESKQAKKQLYLEQRKTKEVLMKLEKARLDLSGFRKLEELQFPDKFNLNIRRHKSSNIDDQKNDKDMERLMLHTLDNDTADDTDVTNSQRSIQSNQTISQRSNRTVKHMNITNLNNDASASTAMHQLAKQNHSGKSVAVSRRIDQGDGDAGKISATSLPLLDQTKSKKLSTEYEDDYENEEDEYENNDAQDSEEEEKDGDDDNQVVLVGEDDADLYNENGDYFQESSAKIELPHAGKQIRMKEEISSLHKQISDDYKEREAFLDTFCRQATTGTLKDDTPKKRNSIAAERSVPSSRKHKLLAALKAIDDNKSQD